MHHELEDERKINIYVSPIGIYSQTIFEQAMRAFRSFGKVPIHEIMGIKCM